MISSTYDVAVVGGGASGMIAAIVAAKNNPELRIALIEKNSRVGKKLLATGNGRCNLTNLDQEIIHYHGKNIWFIQQVLQQFDLEETLSFFKSIGVDTTEENGKVFPHSLQASSVLDLLRYRLSVYCVAEICDFSCDQIEKQDDIFCLTSTDEKKIFATSVLIATGGKASPQTGSTGDGYRFLTQFGHKKSPIYPALVQVCVPSKKTLPLKGIKVQASVRVVADNKTLQSECGEVLFTEYGLSGPPIFQLSRFASHATKEIEYVLDLFPEQSINELSCLLAERRKALPDNMLLIGLLHKTVGREILKEFKGAQDDMDALARILKNWTFSVRGTRGWAQAQVTCGGVELAEFSPLTLESKKAKGLYACGEVLDVDGDCGGYNLQWAWSSGAVAGRALAKR